MTGAPAPFYTRHARLRQAQRKISDAEVEAVLANWHARRPGKRGCTVLIGYPNGRYVKVVANLNTNPPTIVTVGD